MKVTCFQRMVRMVGAVMGDEEERRKVEKESIL